MYRSQRRNVDALLRSLQDRNMRSLSSRSSRSPSPWCTAVSRSLQGSKGKSLYLLFLANEYRRISIVAMFLRIMEQNNPALLSDKHYLYCLRPWFEAMTDLSVTLTKLVLSSFTEHDHCDYFGTCGNERSTTAAAAKAREKSRKLLDRLTLDISLYICDAIILPNFRTPVCLHRFRDLAVRFVYRSIAFYWRFDVNNSMLSRQRAT